MESFTDAELEIVRNSCLKLEAEIKKNFRVNPVCKISVHGDRLCVSCYPCGTGEAGSHFISEKRNGMFQDIQENGLGIWDSDIQGRMNTFFLKAYDLARNLTWCYIHPNHYRDGFKRLRPEILTMPDAWTQPRA